MALFGKSDSLSAILKRIESAEPIDPVELEILIETAGGHPDFRIEKNLWMFSHPSEKVRGFGGKLALSKNDPALADLLIKEMPGKPSSIRQEIARIVVGIAPQRILAHLGDMVHSSAVEQREAALDLISEHGRWRDFLAYLKQTLKDRSGHVRYRTARILARDLDSQAIFLLLRDLIHDEDATLRHIVIEAFAEKPTAEIVEPFFARLILEGPEERSLMLRALSHLARKSQEEIEDRVLPMLGDENPAIRDMAVRLLREMPDQTRVLRAFLVHCRGLAFWLRERSLGSILKISENLTEPLLKLMGDSEDDVRVGAMLMAGGSKDQRLIPIIRGILEGDSDWWIRSMAAEVLGRFPGPQVTAVLLEKLNDPDLRYTIISILGKREGEDAARALLSCLDDPQKGIRLAAVTSLASRKTPETLEAIARAAREDPDESVRAKAEELLGGFGDAAQAILEEIAARRSSAEAQAPEDEGPIGLEMVNESLNRR